MRMRCNLSNNALGSICDSHPVLTAQVCATWLACNRERTIGHGTASLLASRPLRSHQQQLADLQAVMRLIVDHLDDILASMPARH